MKTKTILKIMLMCLGVSAMSFATHIKDVQAVTEVYGDGEKLSTVILTYDQMIKGNSVSKDDYSVPNRTVKKAYVNNTAQKSNTSKKSGKYVIVELEELPLEDTSMDMNPQDEEERKKRNEKGFSGPTLGGKGNAKPLENITAQITQKGTVVTSNGKKYGADSTVLNSSNTRQLVIEDFVQLTFTDKDGKTLMYNLYKPKNYNPQKKYPLVVFMHDAGAVSSEHKYTLSQGNGATAWASPEWQKKHESFVLAPQYEVVTVNDKYEYGPELDRTINLIKDLTQKYSIDTNRIYNTGQSMGGMSSISMDSRYPDIFAASYIVAAKWDVNVTTPMAKQNIWFVNSEGDKGAYPSLAEITNHLEKNGACVERMVVNAEQNQTAVNAEVKSKIKKDCNVYLTTYIGGSHRYTWQHAYLMTPAMEWIFSQTKNR